MSSNARASAAQRLLDNPDLTEVLAEIRDTAVAVFLSGTVDTTSMARAHDDIRAINTIAAALQARLTEKAIADKAERRHRANDPT